MAIVGPKKHKVQDEYDLTPTEIEAIKKVRLGKVELLIAEDSEDFFKQMKKAVAEEEQKEKQKD
jgi:hypothetical protein